MMSGGVRQDLLRSHELAVRKVDGFASSCCVVTFDSFTDNRTLDRTGFGEGFFASRGIDAIHVISRENDWYQYPEMEAAMGHVYAATRDYQRVVTYGSSMGAYAAIRLAGLAGAHCALAMSPQYSIDRRVAPFEHRWQEPSDRFKSIWERRLPFPVLDQAYVVYDPDNLDGRHAARLRRDFAFTPVPLPQSGHTATGYLQEIGLLQSTILAVCAGDFDVPLLIEEAWRRREQSPQHFLARAKESRRRATRLMLMAEAVRLAPDHAGCLSIYAMELTRAKRFAEALAWHDKAVALGSTHPATLALYSLTLELSGDLVGALAVRDRIAVLTDRASLYEGPHQRLKRRVLAREARSDQQSMLRWMRSHWGSLRSALRERT